MSLNSFDDGHVSHSYPLTDIERFDELMHQATLDGVQSSVVHPFGFEVITTTNPLIIAILMRDTEL